LIGPNLKKKFGRVLYGGSSAVWPPYEITPLKGIQEKLKGKAKIVKDASTADVAVVFVGLNHGKGQDSEASDRMKLGLPDKQVQLINETAKDNPNTVVAVIAGSPIAMNEWLNNVPVVLDAWHSGMEGGRAIANILFGDANPSGKLPVTFPRKLGDSPAHSTGNPRNYPGDEERNVYYDEGIFVGYRWFDEKEITPLFPFGFGLSYTSFEFTEIEAQVQDLSDSGDAIRITVEVENIGKSTGAEVVQVYSHDVESSVEKPPQELVGFEKVVLQPGEKKSVPVLVRAKDLMFYDVSKHDWHLEPGEYELRVGNSSRNILSKHIISF
ncbi:MAG: glycoside hydrolase family 3 C-terminal domain-containing protein, partial [Promethearchaeota archaeon]